MKPMNAMPMKPKPAPMGQRMMGTPTKTTAPGKQPPKMKSYGTKFGPNAPEETRSPQRFGKLVETMKKPPTKGTMPKKVAPDKMSPKKSALMRAIKKG